MSDAVLVAYATKYGSTREVADVVGETLRELGFDAEVRPAGEVTDLGPYRSVILGAPFYIGKLLKDATAFLERHQATLSVMPVALFTLGPLKADDDLDEAREQMDHVLGTFTWLKPAAADMFVGKYDPNELRGLDKLVTKPKASPLHGLTAHDDRDWDAIRRWATGLPAALRLTD